MREKGQNYPNLKVDIVNRRVAACCDVVAPPAGRVLFRSASPLADSSGRLTEVATRTED
jgi:hypothetical protein